MNKVNNKPIGEEKQSLMKRWSEELTKKLPPSLDQSAKEYGAILRKREIKGALGLIQAMLMYVVSDLSQRMLAACTVVLGIARISDQAWQKKFHEVCHG